MTTEEKAKELAQYYSGESDYKEIIIDTMIVAGANCVFSLSMYFPVHIILTIFDKILTTSEELKFTAMLAVCIDLIYLLCGFLHKNINSK